MTGSTTRKTSLYRLRRARPPDEVDMLDYIVPSYLSRDGFSARPVDHDGLSGVLVVGSIAKDEADWCAALRVLSGLDVSEQNRTSLALLLLRTDQEVYAVTCGMGHLLLRDSQIDPGFGIEFAVRCLDEERITKIRRQMMDSRGRTDENAATSGEHIRGFGIEEFGEIVSQISGQIDDVGLTFCRERNRRAHVSASDRSVKLQLGTTPSTLLRDLEEIEQVCARPSPLPGFDFIAQVRPLPLRSDRVRQLDATLDEQLGGAEGLRLAVAVPGECRDRFDQAESFSVAVGSLSGRFDEPNAEDIVAAVADCTTGQRLRSLRAGRIQMFADAEGSEPISRSVPADHWITAEIDDGAVHHFYWQGRWYEVGAEYVAVIERRITELLELPADVDLPRWPAGYGHDESWYNQQIAGQDGYMLLDKDNVHTGRLRGGGLEIADALGPGGQLICVKKADKTAPLNHLFSQARTAVETIRFDTEAREKFLAKVPENHALDRRFRTPTVVLGVKLKGGEVLTSRTLFAFAQVTLLHAATALQGMGAELQIVSISG